MNAFLLSRFSINEKMRVCVHDLRSTSFQKNDGEVKGCVLWEKMDELIILNNNADVRSIQIYYIPFFVWRIYIWRFAPNKVTNKTNWIVTISTHQLSYSHFLRLSATSSSSTTSPVKHRMNPPWISWLLQLPELVKHGQERQLTPILTCWVLQRHVVHCRISL